MAYVGQSYGCAIILTYKYDLKRNVHFEVFKFADGSGVDLPIGGMCV